MEDDAAVGIDGATGAASLCADIERADVDGVGYPDIEAEGDDGSAVGVG